MIIIISNPETLKNELKTIIQMFDEGLDIFHIRRKEYSEEEMKTYIEKFPIQHFNKLVLHSHFNLVGYYGLRGMHISFSYNGNIIENNKLSISFHSLEEILKEGRYYDYGFLSPVFDSISKKDYRTSLDLNKAGQFLCNRTEKIVALGGINEGNIDEVKRLGFSGIALLGAIWQSNNPVEKYKQIKKLWQ